MRTINDLHNDAGNGVAARSSVQRVGNIGVVIDQDLSWLLTLSGLLTKNGLVAPSEAADLVSTGVVSEVTLTARCCRAFCDYPRE